MSELIYKYVQNCESALFQLRQSSMFLGVASAPNSLLWQPRRYCLHYISKTTVRTVLKFGFGNWVQYEYNKNLKSDNIFMFHVIIDFLYDVFP